MNAGLVFVAGEGRFGQQQYSVNLTQLEKLPVYKKADRKAYQHQQYLNRKEKVEITQ
jgi:ribosomal protein L31E